MSYSKQVNPKSQAFLADLIAVCRKHNLALGHEDCHGGFEVRQFDERIIDWLGAAADETGPDATPYSWQV